MTSVAGRDTGQLTPARKARLVLEILAAYLQVRRLLARHELPVVLRYLRSISPDAGRRPLGDQGDGFRLGRAVARTLAPLPVDTGCLVRSLVLLRMLASRGTGGSLVIAVRPGEDLSLAAHAWVELEGRPLLAPASADHGRLVTL